MTWPTTAALGLGVLFVYETTPGEKILERSRGSAGGGWTFTSRPHAHSYGFSSQQARETCRARAADRLPWPLRSLSCLPSTELVHAGDFSIGCRAQRGSYSIVITSQSYCPGATELAEGPPNPEATRCRKLQQICEDVFFWGKRTP